MIDIFEKIITEIKEKIKKFILFLENKIINIRPNKAIKIYKIF
jgi:hypothetical protein